MCFKTYVLISSVLFMKYHYTNGLCSSLTSTLSTTFTCRYNNETLENCTNPIDGTEALVSCNPFHENPSEVNKNPKRLCNAGRWDHFIPECYPICGRSHQVPRSDRRNDQDLLLNHPWNVGIYNQEKELICGGTLIKLNVVLTAARFILNGKKYLVGAGKYYSDYDDIRDQKSAQYSEENNIIFKINVPETYIGWANYYAFDLAIAILTTPFSVSLFVQPICINTDIQSQSMHDLMENISTISGYIYKEDKVFDELKETTVVVIPCHVLTKREINTPLETCDKICLAPTTNATIFNFCNGSGLVVKNKINDRYYIQGLLSQPDGNPINEKYFFTSITANIDFLMHHLGNHNENCQLPSFPLHGEYILNGNVVLADPDEQIRPQSRLSLSCHTGYYTSGENQSYCSDNGHWTPVLGTCESKPVIFTKYYVPRNSYYPEEYTTRILYTSEKNTTCKILIFLDKSTTFYQNFTLQFAILIFVIAIIQIFYILKYKRKKKLRRELKLSGLYYFWKGNLKKFNPQLGISDQAELLPYNINYEFPIDNLKFRKQIGSGTFGIVIKADAFGIIPQEEKTTVAVKTLKEPAEGLALKAFISELKIMVHLGQHLNVVNLLGACTKDIKNRKLLVIVEYCRFGDLYNYLFLNRHNYLNQIDSATGNIDYSYGCKDVQPMLAALNNSSKNGADDTMSIISNLEAPHSRNDGIVSCSSNIQLQSKSNSFHDPNKTVKPISTKDLISWAFQVACGMEYLSSRKIIHGDLAARNILLHNNNIVKICDFGLSKKLYKRDEIKLGDSPLPLKWMAMESIRDGVFSIRSDVWSYGIMLWEFFSLSQTPYPGMEDDQRLYKRLLDGYRMEAPEYAPKDIYKIMRDCWDCNPLLRPSFSQLVTAVGLMLEENIRQHYIDLNDPYFVMNTQRLIEYEYDCLNQLLLSDEHRCINSDNFNSNNNFGYLVVKPSPEDLTYIDSTSNTDSISNNKSYKNVLS